MPERPYEASQGVVHTPCPFLQGLTPAGWTTGRELTELLYLNGDSQGTPGPGACAQREQPSLATRSCGNAAIAGSRGLLCLQSWALTLFRLGGDEDGCGRARCVLGGASLLSP